MIASGGWIYLRMQLNTVIFDMDGLLVDSEPLWGWSSQCCFWKIRHPVNSTAICHHNGLRTKEFIHWWFSMYNVPLSEIEAAEEAIIKKVIELVKGRAMPGGSIFLNFISRGFKIGLASSSQVWSILRYRPVGYPGLKMYALLLLHCHMESPIRRYTWIVLRWNRPQQHAFCFWRLILWNDCSQGRPDEMRGGTRTQNAKDLAGLPQILKLLPSPTSPTVAASFL